MKIRTIESLLQQTSVVNRLYKKILQLTGDNFNIFKIIGLTSNEVRVHSAFIAELLNPKGSHGQGALFLNLFIKELNLKTELNGDKVIVEIEKSIGTKTENTGGRIDTFISDNSGKSIIIENKIYAGDQENQLIRYNTFAQRRKCPYELLYLTLEGKDASQKSVGAEKIIYKSISYKNEITHWLETCQKEIGSQLVLREGITHYINLIRYLTNQTSNQAMENEIESILKKSADNLESALLLSNSIDNVKMAILNDFWNSIKVELKKHDKTVDAIRAEEVEKRTRGFFLNSASGIEGLRVIIKEENGYRFYWGCDILNHTFMSGFYIRKYEDKEEILPTSDNDYDIFEEYRCILNECGFNNSNRWWLAYKIEQDLNFRIFTPTVCSFVEKEKSQFYVDKIVSEAVSGIKAIAK